MPNTFQALKSRRVAEALDSVRRHVQIAIKLTRMESVGTSVQELRRAPLPPLPEVTAIQPDEINYEDRAESTDITVTGENLDGVREVLLIHRDEVAPWSASADKINHSVDVNGEPDGKSFTAHIAKVASAPAGSFNLLLIDDAGQTTLSTDVFTINPPAEAGQISGQKSSLQLGGVFPNGSREDTTIPAVVVVLSGKPTEFCITDMDDNEQSDWSVEIVEKDAWGKRFNWKPSYVTAHTAQVQQLFPKKAKLVLLIITIPGRIVERGDFRQIFKLVGKSEKPTGEDSLAFFVRRELEQTY